MRTKAVLLVDDEESILASLSNYLRKNGFHVQTAPSGEEALVKLGSAYFDLVITDLAMAGISGIEIVQETKKLYPDTCVFILTGHGNMESAIAALHAGAYDYILKPCDPEDLLLKMTHFFEKQAALKKLKLYEKILPMCMYCKKIRDDSDTEFGAGKWLRLEEYLHRKSGTDISHGCCPECKDKMYQDWVA